MLLEGIFWNSSARIELNANPEKGGDKYVLEGNVTE